MAMLDAPVGPQLLHQASIWRAYGDNGMLQTMFLEEMTPAHRVRVLERLRELAPELLAAEMTYTARRWRLGFISDRDHAYTMAAIENASPEMWIEEQALVRRLRQLGARPASYQRRGLLRRLIRR